MDVIEAFNSRRSYRNFDPNFEIPEADLNKLVDMVLDCPSFCNFQGNDLLVVTDRKKIDEATKIIFDSWSKEQQDTFNKRKEEYGCKNVITGDASAIIFIVSNERADKDLKKVDAGVISMAIMMLARSFGLDTLGLGCLYWGNTKGMEEYLGIGEGNYNMAVAIGKPLDRTKITPKERLCKATYLK
ncbi:nitroreductase family protein [Histomonas meleagridis]|uniref:nitroreductase family protein n=1 Tax=Histomonas meleagridis TaxID=135588 RepID=UPI00355A1A9B|nr:nitroreductase family protein [Histomonas meleagridis]KAH0797759.1 nitroreductase family protein [Histomonas meleagridis]